MKRREFLPFTLTETKKSEQTKPPRVLSGLSPYTGEFSILQFQHLIRRTTFGISPAALRNYKITSLSNTLNSLLTPTPIPAAPVNYTNGAAWTSQAFDSANNGLYIRQMKSWWLGNMVNSGVSIHEKMTLFWHNLLVTEADTVGDARLTYIYYSHLRKYALGNIKDLVKGITKDIAMLRYLNGNTNQKGKPNENYARELQELFTIGKGPEISPGNYTNYTEDDIKAAARVLTGWKDDRIALKEVFDAAKHDTTDKVFSAAFQNTVIKGKTGASAGDEELNDLIDMIFRQKETARYYSRKLYRWFVYYEIDETTEKNVIEPLADLLIANNYNVLPVLNALFSSEHFFDQANYWVMIKNPIDFITSLMQTFEVKFPDFKTDPANYYAFLDKLIISGALVEMNLLDPPSVAGWSPYYQTPDFYQIWINTSTMPNRNGFTDALIYGSKYYGAPFTLDLIEYAKKYISVPSDGVTLVKEICDILIYKQLSDKQLDYLGETILMQGSPIYEWNGIWQTYISKPNDTTAKNNVKLRLQALLRFILRMAEFQLS